MRAAVCEVLPIASGYGRGVLGHEGRGDDPQAKEKDNLALQDTLHEFDQKERRKKRLNQQREESALTKLKGGVVRVQATNRFCAPL